MSMRIRIILVGLVSAAMLAVGLGAAPASTAAPAKASVTQVAVPTVQISSADRGDRQRFPEGMAAVDVDANWKGAWLHFSRSETVALAFTAGACGSILGWLPAPITQLFSKVCTFISIAAGAMVLSGRCLSVFRAWILSVPIWYARAC
jgi:hypothetical protein